MQETAAYQELARRFGLEAVPQSVLQLTQLVAMQDSDVDQIASVISKDPGLRARLLRVANPRAECEADYTVDTVEAALMRNGIGCALLLAMGTPLAQAIVKTFQTMLSIKLESIEPRKAAALAPEHTVGTIGFAGKAVGAVYLRMSTETAKAIAALILGLKPAELDSQDMVNDVIGELLNIVTGNLKSNLCDAGLECRLQTPQVALSSQCPPPQIQSAGLERMAFCSPQLQLFVHMAVNPWNG